MRLPLRSWTNTLQLMGFRRKKQADERPAKRLAFEPLEERRVLSGLSPVLSIDPAAAQKFWSQQLATGSPLLSGPVANFAPPGARPTLPPLPLGVGWGAGGVARFAAVARADHLRDSRGR
jgi:hypothetical protein